MIKTRTNICHGLRTINLIQKKNKFYILLTDFCSSYTHFMLLHFSISLSSKCILISGRLVFVLKIKIHRMKFMFCNVI